MSSSLSLNANTHLRFIGPPIEEGPLPAIFYFALSADESLELDPYNQPAVFFAEKQVRVFSIDLPAHGPNLNPVDAIKVWAQEMAEGKDPLSPFLETVNSAIDELIEKRWVLREKIALMGLSRGGFIASHIAARRSDIHTTVCFAPLTKLSAAKEFAEIKDLDAVKNLDLTSHTQALKDAKMRYYIGNRDIRVHTDLCFQFVLSLAEESFSSGERSPPIELIVSPSIGHMGHGTSKETFHAGATFLGKRLGVL